MILRSLSLDHLVICSFYAVCRVYNINITFHNILDVYTAYLLPFQTINSIVDWGDVNRLWFEVDLKFIPDHGPFTSSSQPKVSYVHGTMVDLYNTFFVPFVYHVIQYYHALLQTGDARTLNSRPGVIVGGMN